jgi:uncharacterized membrane protein
MAVTPNGDVHLVWSLGNKVHYTRMDHNGSILNENVTISDSVYGVGPPRIAAAHDDNTIYIVWHDYRDGNAEVYYAKMTDGLFGVTPENHRLTHDPATSLYPRVTVDPDDNVHVVWGDDRDGNSEIYYKFMYNYKFEFAPINVAELGQMTYFHPNQTKIVGFYIENQGPLPDGYRVNMSHDDSTVGDGWSFSLDETEFLDVDRGKRVYLNLTISSPVAVNEGDFVKISLTATSLSSSSMSKTLRWLEFVIVVKDVALESAHPSKVMDSGGEVSFHLNITNIGDVPDIYNIYFSLKPENMGWEASLDLTQVMLSEGESVTFAVRLRAPEWAKDNETGTVFVRVQSMSEAEVHAGVKLVGLINPAFSLEMETLEPIKWVHPGEAVSFPITVRNVGNMHAKLTVYLTSTDPLPGWKAFMNSETMLLAGGEARNILMTVTAPVNALAGLRQELRVLAVTEDYSSRADVEVTVMVSQVHDISPNICTDVHQVYAGETTPTNLITVFNEGNGIETVILDITQAPPGWVVTFEHEDMEVNELVLMAQVSKTFTVVVKAPFDAPSGFYQLHLVLLDTLGHEYIVSFPVSVHQLFGMDFSAIEHYGAGPPGGVISYSLVLRNNGNGEDTFNLELTGLPSAKWVAYFHDTSGRILNRVTLAPGEQMQIGLRVTVPEDRGHVYSIELIAQATSISAEMDEVKLTLDVTMADVTFQSVVYDPSRMVKDRPNLVTVRVENIGVFRADNVTIVMLVNGKEVGRDEIRTINMGGNASITFSWSPKDAQNLLTYRVSCDTPESNEHNNELIHRKSPASTPPSNGVWVWVVILALAVVVIAQVIQQKRYMDQDEGR